MTQAYKKQAIPPSRNGKSSRGMGVEYLTTLNVKERQTDLTEIQKFSITSSNYTLQLHRHLQNLITHAPLQPYDPDYMIYRETGGRRKPVESKAKLPPEEERRLSLKRKTLSRAESTREHLETQYMSLRAHYVAASQRLATSRLGTDGVCKLLMSLTERRSKALGYRRVRLNVAREIQQVINLRLGALKSPTPELEPNFADAAELVKVWDLIENTVVASEQGCWDKELGGLVGESLKGNFKKEDGGNRKNVPRQPLKNQVTATKPPILWENSTHPTNTPRGLPLLLTPLSSYPSKACAASYSSVFGAGGKSLGWIEGGMPNSNSVREIEQNSLASIKAECEHLSAQAVELRKETIKVQALTVEKRKQTQTINNNLQMVRTETEAVLSRHQLVLDTPEGQSASSTLRAALANKAEADKMAKEAEEESQGESEGEDVEVESNQETAGGFMSGGAKGKAVSSPKNVKGEESAEDMMSLLTKGSEIMMAKEEENLDSDDGGEKTEEEMGEEEEEEEEE